MDTQCMVHPKQWRETCDPFALDYSNFQLNEILGYPHAGNDVFHVRGIANGNETTAYIKVARQNGAAIDNEVNILAQLDAPIFPKVLDYDRKHGLFSVTAEMPGLRLSTIAGDNADLVSLTYMEEYGETLGRVHKLNVSAKPQVDRKFYHRPSEEMLKKLNLQFLSDYFDRKPLHGETVFCHGDFHYANVLWKDQHISAILDFELAGYGNRDFDIAWALFLRPGQRFLKTDKEQALFIKGYQKHGDCNVDAVKYYMHNAMCISCAFVMKRITVNMCGIGLNRIVAIEKNSMIRPILACLDPYKTAEQFAAAGWNIDFSQPPESGDPLVGVSLFGNSVLLGVTDGYVADNHIQYIGCGVAIYLTVPAEQIVSIYQNHIIFHPTELTAQPWGDLAFEVKIGGYQFMIAAVQG